MKPAEGDAGDGTVVAEFAGVPECAGTVEGAGAPGGSFGGSGDRVAAAAVAAGDGAVMRWCAFRRFPISPNQRNYGHDARRQE